MVDLLSHEKEGSKPKRNKTAILWVQSTRMRSLLQRGHFFK